MEREPISSTTIHTLYKYDSEYCADSIEWCPHAPHKNIFVCANYQLIKSDNKEQERIGRILLFSVNPTEGLELNQTLDTAAVLDQKWCHNKINDHSLLAVVNAKKTLEIYRLNFDKNYPQSVVLKLVTQYVVSDDESETLILSLDWSTGKYETEIPQIICSDSKGNIHRFKYQNEKLELCQSWHAHEFEAWIAAFYYWDINIAFTGGDDSLLQQFDKRVGNLPVLKNKTHQAGVTSIHSNAKKEYVLATGSYDTYLRLWDIRQMKTPKDELQMPGTLWRLKWNPHNFQLLLAACMLGGVHIVDVGEKVEVVESYYEHKNLSYGADWSYLIEGDSVKFEGTGKFVVGSCSFYDQLLCIWKSNCKFNNDE